MIIGLAHYDGHTEVVYLHDLADAMHWTFINGGMIVLVEPKK